MWGCNGYKGEKIKALDTASNNFISLFNPRKDTWLDHFRWDDENEFVIGITPKGRATTRLLQLNREGVLNIRKLTILTGEHPPQ